MGGDSLNLSDSKRLPGGFDGKSVSKNVSTSKSKGKGVKMISSSKSQSSPKIRAKQFMVHNETKKTEQSLRFEENTLSNNVLLSKSQGKGMKAMSSKMLSNSKSLPGRLGQSNLSPLSKIKSNKFTTSANQNKNTNKDMIDASKKKRIINVKVSKTPVNLVSRNVIHNEAHTKTLHKFKSTQQTKNLIKPTQRSNNKFKGHISRKSLNVMPKKTQWIGDPHVKHQNGKRLLKPQNRAKDSSKVVRLSGGQHKQNERRKIK